MNHTSRCARRAAHSLIFAWCGAIASAVAAEVTPANDLFANRTVVHGANVTVSGTLVGATAEPGDPIAQARATVWWTWTAPATGAVAIGVTGEGFSPFLVIFTGPALPALQAVPIVATPRVVRHVFHAVAGTTYQIVVDNTVDGTRGPVTVTVESGPGPANDMFSDAIVLTGAVASSTGTMVNATVEAGEPRLGSISTGGTLWWRWTAPASGRALLSANSPFVNVLQAFTGGAITSLNSIVTGTSPLTGGSVNSAPISTGPSRVAFDATAGITYQIAIGNFYGESVAPDDVSLHLTLVASPANDRFAARIAIPATPLTINASNLGASAEGGEEQFGRPAAFATVWWTWIAPANGGAAIDTSGSAITPAVAVFTGSDLTTLTVVAAHNTATSGTQILNFNTIAGTSYHIRLDGHAGATGDLRFALSFAEPPPNDRFVDRASLSGSSVQVMGRNDGASAESGEPMINYQNARATVWWTWTAPATGTAVLDTDGTDFNAVLGVFTGSALPSLVPVTFQSYLTDNVDTVRLTFAASAASTYQIAVDGELGAIGRVVFRLAVHTPPVNDTFASRVTLTGAAVSAQGTSLGASRETEEPGHAFQPTVASVWWSWTAPASARMIAATHGSGYDTVLAVYTGTSVGSLTSVAYNDDAPGGGAASALAFDAVAGTTYQFAVDGHLGAMGAIAFDLRVAGPPDVAVHTAKTSVIAGETLTLDATASGLGPYLHQWMRNGVDIAGATGASLLLPSMQDFLSGDYAVRVTNEFGTSTSSSVSISATSPPDAGARLPNLSTRALDLTGDNVLIPGFVIAGPGNKKLLIRGVGPTLGMDPFNLSGVLPDPRLTLKRWNGAGYDDVTSNDNWGTNSNLVDLLATSNGLLAFPLVSGSSDAALLVELEPGQYSVVTDDAGGETGITIFELYDADVNDPTSTARLINISTRGFVGTDDAIMIPGFVVSHDGPKTLLIRVVGPTLGQPPYNVAGVLADPTLSIYRHDFSNNSDTLILTNDDWSVGPGATRTTEVAAQVQAFALPSGSKDAAFVVTLNPGVYTVHARGANNTTGVALVEVYAVE